MQFYFVNETYLQKTAPRGSVNHGKLTDFAVGAEISTGQLAILRFPGASLCQMRMESVSGQ